MNQDDKDEGQLPEGFYYDETRKVDFVTSDPTPGAEGLAYAILLSAVSDGCCPKWLQAIAEFYDIKVDTRLFSRAPTKKISLDSRSNEFFDPMKEPHRRRPKKNELSNFMFGFKHPQPNIQPQENPTQVPLQP